MQIIPLQKIPAQRFQIVLDGQYCTLAIYWRWGRCYADLMVGSTTVFQGSVCLHLQKLNMYENINFTGSLYFVDTQAQDAPQWKELGERWVLVYLSENESLEEALGA